MASVLPSSTNLLITGIPGAGKTTCVTKLVNALQKLPNVALCGFFTEECRDPYTNRRAGFDIVSLSGVRAPLARIEDNDNRRSRSQHRVGRYTVDLKSFEHTVLPLMNSALKRDDKDEKREANQVFVMDEIGKMELFSKRFTSRALSLLDDNSMIVVATVPVRGPEVVERIKIRTDVQLHTLDRSNRDSLPEVLETQISELFEAQTRDICPKHPIMIGRSPEHPSTSTNQEIHENQETHVNREKHVDPQPLGHLVDNSTECPKICGGVNNGPDDRTPNKHRRRRRRKRAAKRQTPLDTGKDN